MKYISVFILYSFLVFGILGNSCKKPNKKINSISILCNYGDGRHFTFIGPNEKSIDSSFYRDTLIKDLIDPIWSKEFYNYHASDLKCIMKLEAFMYLSYYINRHCNKIDRSDPKSITIFTIHSYSDEGDQICTYYYDDKLIKYFDGLIQYMEKSPYQNEYKGLIKQLQLYIKNYSLTN